MPDLTWARIAYTHKAHLLPAFPQKTHYVNG